MKRAGSPRLTNISRSRLFGDRWSRVFLAFALLVALWVRLPGLTTKDLWFDDAWAALPVRASLHDALKMVVTTPLYSLVNRFWIGLHPDATWWAQLPTLTFGLLGVVAIFALLRVLHMSRRIVVLGTTVVALSPTTVTYSTRVKEYAFDFLLGVVLLVLAERFRKDPSTKNTVALSALSILSICISFSTAVVVVGVWLAILLVAVRQRQLRWRIASWCGGTAALTVALVAPFALAVPSVLNRNWRRRGFLFDPSTLHSALHTTVAIFSGLAHGLFGVPIQLSPDTTFWKWWAVVCAVVVVVMLVVMLTIASRQFVSARPTFHRSTPAALCVFVAVLAAFASRVPLGDGRTDEALYPSLLVLVALALGPYVDRGAERISTRSRALTVIAGIVAVAAALSFASLHQARYPTLDLRGLSEKVTTGSNADHHIVTVVDGFNAFTWGYYQLSPTAISFDQDHGYTWPQGFHVTSTSPDVVISNNDMRIPGRFADLATRASAIWYVGFEQGTYNPYSPYPSALRPSATYDELLREGWKPRPGYAQLAEHCYAMLLTR